MILTKEAIEDSVIKTRKIHIEPFKADYLGPNSYDVHLQPILKVYDRGSFPLDLKAMPPTQSIRIPNSGYVLQPNQLYLGATIETVGSDFFVPMLEGCSSLGRAGLNIHATAGFGDLGFLGTWTLELSVVEPVRIYPRMRIGQMFFLVPFGFIERYQGRYLLQNEPEPMKPNPKDWSCND
jgi:dCTP deaminase